MQRIHCTLSLARGNHMTVVNTVYPPSILLASYRCLTFHIFTQLSSLPNIRMLRRKLLVNDTQCHVEIPTVQSSIVYVLLRVLGHRVGGNCAAVAMGVDQANYSTYIKGVQLCITSMQTAVYTQKSISKFPTLFKI